MGLLSWAVALWLAVTGFVILGGIVLAAIRRKAAMKSESAEPNEWASAPVDIFIPVKGRLDSAREALESLLSQSHPNYRAVFIVESESDPANVTVEDLCGRFRQADKVVAGLATGCAQKNHNLVKGVEQLRPDAEILVFCDATNKADPHWLARITEPIAAGREQVVTTFRYFRPEPVTFGGICQVIYASIVLLMHFFQSKPWGGGTAIKRSVFEKLNVVDVWSRTVVDDLVLGNLLEAERIPLKFDPLSLMESPIRNQTVSGFMDFLDRQIMYPKFTNPEIWVITLVWELNVALVLGVTLLLAVVLFPAGLTPTPLGLEAVVFLFAFAGVVRLLKEINPVEISTWRWMAAVVPVVFLGVWVFLRSILRDRIVWGGRTYFVGAGGEVLRIVDDTASPICK